MAPKMWPISWAATVHSFVMMVEVLAAEFHCPGFVGLIDAERPSVPTQATPISELVEVRQCWPSAPNSYEQHSRSSCARSQWDRRRGSHPSTD